MTGPAGPGPGGDAGTGPGRLKAAYRIALFAALLVAILLIT